MSATRRAEGTLEIYELPQMRLVLSVDGLPDGVAVLAMPVAGQSNDDPGDDDNGSFTEVSVSELRLESFPKHFGGSSVQQGPDGASAAPHLVAALSDGTLVVYRAFLPLQVIN